MTVSDQELLDFLGDKRWFGDKGRSVQGAAFREMIPISWPGVAREYAVGRVDVATDAGSSVYQLFVVRGADTPHDALEDEEFRRLLANAFVTGAEFVDGGARWIVASEGKRALVVPPNAPIELAAGEQSNSSVVMNREAILKLYRKLEPGVHPDVEVTRFLTGARAFPHVPVLLGTIRFEDAAGSTIAGMLQEYVRGAVDAWRHALESSSAYFTAKPAEDPTVPFSDDASHLGVVTRAMHEALASGDPGSDFELTPAAATDVRRWCSGAVRTVERALAALDRAVERKSLPRADRETAAAIVASGERHTTALRELVETVRGDAGANTRTHGDYHLGQVIRSATGQFLVIDFEGEPARPLEERRARQSPLRDVAGMLRSFAYAAAEGARKSDKKVAAERAARWEESARAAFLRGYFTPPADPAASGGLRGELLPQSQENVTRLLRVFETEKVFYELQYEIDHRPDWVWIPLRGIAKVSA